MEENQNTQSQIDFDLIDTDWWAKNKKKPKN